MEFLLNPVTLAIISIFILVYSAILHEIAHGYVADRFGDPTARLSGRLTLDPRPHIDPMMSLAIPLLLIISGSPIIFGGAKPVPVDPYNLKDGRKDIALVSLAGPLTNVLIALFGAILIHIFIPNEPLFLVRTESFLGFLLATIVQLNLLLAIFNMLPIPPLDGSKVFALLLPKDWAERFLSLGSMGMLLLLVLLFFPLGGFSIMDGIASLLSFAISLLGL